MCPQVKGTKCWQDFHEQMHWIMIDQQIPQTLQDLIATGYRNSHNSSAPWPHNIINDTQLQEIVQGYWAQLGWHQILYGRFTMAWQGLITEMALQINTANFITKFIHTAWTTIITIWKLRNQHLHAPTMNPNNCYQLQTTVIQILYKANQDNQLAKMVWHLTADIIMTTMDWDEHQTNTTSQSSSTTMGTISNTGHSDILSTKSSTTCIYSSLPKRATPCESVSLWCHPMVTLVIIL